MTTKEKLERANPTVDSLTYRRLTHQITDEAYRKGLAEERRQVDRRTDRQAASDK